MNVLIGTPSGDTILAKTHICLMKLQAATADSGCTGVAGTYVHRNQNVLVKRCLDLGAKYLLLVDSDMMFPPDIANRLIARQKDIVGCTYRARQEPHSLTSRDLDGIVSDTNSTGVREVSVLPSGMMLIRRKVLETLTYPWFFNTDGEKPEDFVGNDHNFCIKARAAGFRIHCDFFASRDIQHLGTIPIGWHGVQG